ncbi:MAG: 50S ribosome-binding GTPase [Bacilli bacterium]|nr:50S ribosome-binding GTPase [Bacilli bacterium]
MENKMNILVLGISGAGKSTLIRAISGQEVITGAGEPNTKKIEVFESKTWPIRCIDTKGFEYSFIEQLKTINQVKKYSKKNNNEGIDAVWYCIEGTSRRTFEHNIKLMNSTIKKWKNIPVFVVITKSYSETDIEKNIETINESFSKYKKINLKEIIPVVAEEYNINEETTVAPMGIDELCLKTLECFDEAKIINKENRDRMVIEQRRFTANGTTAVAAASAVVIGAVPIPFADSVILVPLEVGLTKRIFKIYKIDYNNKLIMEIVGSTIITSVAKGIISAIPIAGPVVNAVVAGAIVFALGEGVIGASELIINGKLDTKKVDEVSKFVGEKVKNNPIIGELSEYFEKNKDNIKDKKPEEIFEDLKKSLKK